MSISDSSLSDDVMEKKFIEFKMAIAEKTLSAMEQVDAYVFTTRDRSRSIGWNDIKLKFNASMQAAKNIQAIEESIKVLSDSMLTKHGYVSINKAYSSRKKINFKVQLDSKISFTYPTYEYYSVDSQRPVDKIDGVKIDDLKSQYFEYKCRSVAVFSCHFDFLRKVNRGWNPITRENIKSIELSGGLYSSTKIIDKEDFNLSDCRKFSDIENIPNMELLESLWAVCVYRYKDSLMIKLPSFYYSTADFKDDGCSKNNLNQLCNIRREISRVIKKYDPSNLIIDLRGNMGGNNVRPLVGLFLGDYMVPTMVKYKNHENLYSNDFFENIAYGDENANKSWFTLNSDKKQSAKPNSFLPLRSDFCYSGETCKETKTENPYGVSNNINHIILLLDPRCMSSCEEFVYKLQHSPSNKKIIITGLPTMGDIAFARARGIIKLEKDKVVVDFFGDRNDPTAFLSFAIPTSKTYDLRGNEIDGIPITPSGWPYLIPKSQSSLDQLSLKRTLQLVDQL